MNSATDRRYGSRRWKETRLRVLHRDLWTCSVVPGCPVSASVADHVFPVYPGMPDWEFFDERNLRAACRRHNTARGVAARLKRELSGDVEPVKRNPLVAPYQSKPRIY